MVIVVISKTTFVGLSIMVMIIIICIIVCMIISGLDILLILGNR